MPIIQSCCCWRSLRRGCYAAAIYTMIYFSVTIVTMGHFIDMEQSYLNGDMPEPESDSFLEPEKITPITVSLNITLLACSTMGLISCALLIFGVFKDIKLMLLPWIISMGLETLVEIINLVYLFYLQTMNFNPITSFLFTMDFFIIVLNVYAMVCVISQFQEYLEGRGTAAFDYSDRLPCSPSRVVPLLRNMCSSQMNKAALKKLQRPPKLPKTTMRRNQEGTSSVRCGWSWSPKLQHQNADGGAASSTTGQSHVHVLSAVRCPLLEYRPPTHLSSTRKTPCKSTTNDYLRRHLKDIFLILDNLSCFIFFIKLFLYFFFQGIEINA